MVRESAGPMKVGHWRIGILAPVLVGTAYLVGLLVMQSVLQSAGAGAVDALLPRLAALTLAALALGSAGIGAVEKRRAILLSLFVYYVALVLESVLALFIFLVSKRDFLHIIEAASLGILQVDPTGQVVLFSERFSLSFPTPYLLWIILWTGISRLVSRRFPVRRPDGEKTASAAHEL